MTRDELLEDIAREVRRTVPEDRELSGEDIDTIETTVEDTLENATSAIDYGDAFDAQNLNE